MENRELQVVLTIDDEEAIRNSFRNFLEDCDYRVLEAENGRKGLELFEQEKPDIILVDLRMPEVDGLEVLTRVKEISPETPIIVVSGTGVIGDAVEALHLGAWDYLLKPVIDLSMLLHAVEKSLERSRLIRENKRYQEHLEEEVEGRTNELTCANLKLNSINDRLATSEAKFRTLAETSPTAIMMFQDNKWIYSNHAGAVITGYSESELIGMECMSMVHPDFRSLAQEKFTRVVSSHMTFTNLEFQITTKASEVRWVYVSGGFTEMDGRSAGIISVLDINEKKMAEEALKELNKTLEQRVRERTSELEGAKREADAAAEAKSFFLANMSHEIRTPLNGIIAAADLALSEELATRVASYLNIIHSSGYALMSIINDILDFSKIEAGKLELEERPFMLNELVANVISLFSGKALAKDIDFIVDIATDVPYALIGDRLRIRQILTNLLSNAFKFTEDSGTIILGAEATCESEDSSAVELEFFIEDTGIGMSDEAQQYLFQPFTQADSSTTRKFGGTGLGLSICSQLVAMMNGSIWVKSVAGIGTTFYFTIAVEKNTHADQKRLVFPEEATGFHILIGNGSEPGTRALRRILDNFGFHVETASTADEFLARLEEQKRQGRTCDMLFIDSDLPGMGGEGVAGEVRATMGLHIPTLLMISNGADIVFKGSAEDHYDGFLEKPFYEESVYESMMEAMGKGAGVARKKRAGISVTASVYKNLVRGMSVLVAEDNPVNQVVARAMLEGAGISVEIVANGREAVDTVKKRTFDAVFMDVQMPEMDGYEATRAIRRSPGFETLPIIAMTAHALKGDEEKCLEAGMTGYVSKPIKKEILYHTLWKVVEETKSKKDNLNNKGGGE